ncbi:MAG: hypothetical protein ABS79_01845 [Planctomycetes bacterium SCN 63-9]|nr:MAG: hypothetical protein ABS79_01845 [Planctomycetes bacterium SCN 63-9]
MNRLDSVIGPENWWDEYTQLQNGILCKLTVRLPDGEEICKSDAGGHAGMSDEGDDEKSGFSDAFKRAAVKFGIGRHLYGEGIPRFTFPAPNRPDLSTKSNGNGHGNGNGNGTAKVKGAAESNGSARASRGRPARAEREAVGAGSNGSAQKAVAEPATANPSAAPLAFGDGPRSSREFYDYVKALDPEGANGTRDFLVKWGKEQGYPGLVKEWSDDQARAGYERIKAHLEASAAE